MLQNETWPIWALLIGVVMPMVAVVALCVCGCKKTVPKTSSTVNRSLPAIPNDPERLHLEGRDPLWEEANGDTSSELYATVEDNKHSIQPLMQGDGMPGVLKRVSALNSQPDESKNSSADDGLNLYACVKADHPYDKLKKSEHPYAQVKSSSHISGDGLLNEPGLSRASLRNEDVGVASCSGVPSGSTCEINDGNPIPPPRTRKSNSHGSLIAAAAATQPPGSVPDIPAATAIAGHVSANQELPYMTPPILASTNFSGDSQDSKGYTSISVREPLANIKAQTKANSQRSRAQELVDSHYATVSDDSDEMYAAIEEPSQLYTSGSETYAQIQPTPVPEPQPLPMPMPVMEPYFPPQPPSVDSLKHVAQAHSRQASSSSATSSVANLGSPKPEKRQANSPLPAPPGSSPELYKKCSLLSSDPAASLNLEEMYAKVLKKKKERHFENDAVEDIVNGAANNSDSVGNISVETIGSVSLRTRRDPDRVSVGSSEIAQELKIDSSSYDTSPVQSSDDIYCGYEKLHDSDNIRRSRDVLISESDYESVTARSVKYDPGYEVVEQVKPVISDGEPNYEELRPQSTQNNSSNETVGSADSSSGPVIRTFNSGDPGYERVHSDSSTNEVIKEGDDSSEPNYESMPSEEPEHNYAGLLGAAGGNESDPNYEMVEHEDPNYESVNYFEANCDPPYERLQNDDTIPGYEQVRPQNNNITVGYEMNSAQTVHKNRPNSEPGYEEVGKKHEEHLVDVWKGTELNSHNTNCNHTNSINLITGSKGAEDHTHSISEQTDMLYSQVQKKFL
ncbi:uncharacterized protein [Anabrus simplex]|uniref:uncharacterized protein isoform X2 n=1 Tax=Anabrus simplex TaxID=316456 RepID=UPI0035A3149D